MATLLGIATGLAGFTALICFALKLYTRNRYPGPEFRNSHGGSVLFSSDNGNNIFQTIKNKLIVKKLFIKLKFYFSKGIPLTLHGRPSSRSSERSNSGGNLLSSYGRRSSSMVNRSGGGGGGALVSSSRAGASRAAAILLISYHLQATNAVSNKQQRRTNAEGSGDGLGRLNIKLQLCCVQKYIMAFFLHFAFERTICWCPMTIFFSFFLFYLFFFVFVFLTVDSFCNARENYYFWILINNNNNFLDAFPNPLCIFVVLVFFCLIYLMWLLCIVTT